MVRSCAADGHLMRPGKRTAKGRWKILRPAAAAAAPATAMSPLSRVGLIIKPLVASRIKEDVDCGSV